MKETMTNHNYFYVQIFVEGGMPEIIHHSQDEETGEFYYKFLSRAEANKLLKAEKKINPNNKYRVVRLRESYFATEWE